MVAMKKKYNPDRGKKLKAFGRSVSWLLWALTYIGAIAVVVGLVYRFGFHLSEIDRNLLIRVNRIAWALFLLHFTFRLLFERRELRGAGKFLTITLGISLYLTLIPTIFSMPQDGVLLYLWKFFSSNGYHIAVLLLTSIVHISGGIVHMLGRKTNPAIIMAFSFLAIILMGSGLLMLPKCNIDGISWVNSLFISTSAVCVTGLTPLDVSATLTTEGFVVLVCLIQIGGLGVMTLTSFFAMFFMGNTSFYNRVVVKDMINSDSIGSLLSTMLHILGFTLVIETCGMLLIWWDIHGTLGMSLNGELAFSAFHAISAFCNAGFSTLPGNLGNPTILSGGHNLLYIAISLLIIFGGIGFPILVNFKNSMKYHLKRFWKTITTFRAQGRRISHLYSLNTKIVLSTTLGLLIVGTICMLVFEWNGAFAGMPIADKITQAFFNATCPRTAGFTSVDLTTLSMQSIMMYMILMWVGGAAQSTAGGMKVNAFAVVMLNMVAVLRGANKVEAYGREISQDSIRRANAAMAMSIGILLVFIFVLTLLEPHQPLLAIVFECISALGTVGSSLNLTPLLSDASKLVVVLLMFIGRVGLVTLMLGIAKQKKHENKYNYPVESIIIN